MAYVARGLGRRAFTLMELMIAVLIIGILLAIAVPNFVRARESTRTKSCVSNLKQIDSAKERYAMDNRVEQGGSVTMGELTGVGQYLRTSPECPLGGTYTVNAIGTSPQCNKSGHSIP